MLDRTLGLAVATLLVIGAACGDDDDSAEIDTVDRDGEEADDDTTETTEPTEASGEEGTEDPGALLLIMDSSGSMEVSDDQGRTLLEGAKQALRELVDGLPEDQHVGLRVYGHRYPNTDRENGCQDTELIHPVGPLDREGLLAAIDGYQARGWTPIGLSLQQAADDLPPEGKRTIVLVSDGLDTCESPEPCQVAGELAAEGVEVVINTVGFALDSASPDDAEQARQQLSCIAEAGNGQFVDVADAAGLADALDQVAARDERAYEPSGSSLEGAPLPRSANTGEVDTPYTDTVLGREANFYRFEIPAGSEVRGELVVVGGAGAPSDGYVCPSIHLTDRLDDEDYTWEYGEGVRPTGTRVVETEPAEVDADEVWMKIGVDWCNPAVISDPDVLREVEFDTELQLTVID